MIFYMKRDEGENYAALYRHRSDGDWDFVMVLALETPPFPEGHYVDLDVAMQTLTTIAWMIRCEGDNALIAYFPEPNVPTILEYEPPELGDSVKEDEG